MQALAYDDDMKAARGLIMRGFGTSREAEEGGRSRKSPLEPTTQPPKLTIARAGNEGDAWHVVEPTSDGFRDNSGSRTS